LIIIVVVVVVVIIMHVTPHVHESREKELTVGDDEAAGRKRVEL
jgi:hypothetical protein